MPVFVHVPEVHTAHPRGSGWIECLSAEETVATPIHTTGGSTNGGRLHHSLLRIRVLPGPASSQLAFVYSAGRPTRVTVRYEWGGGKALQFVLLPAFIQSIHSESVAGRPNLPADVVTIAYVSRRETRWEGVGPRKPWPTVPGWSLSRPGAPA